MKAHVQFIVMKKLQRKREKKICITEQSCQRGDLEKIKSGWMVKKVNRVIKA